MQLPGTSGLTEDFSGASDENFLCEIIGTPEKAVVVLRRKIRK